MPNHVTHKLIFDVEHAERVFALCTEGCLDFARLVPPPAHLYRGSLSMEDQDDFKDNWLEWNQRFWGTKWGAYSGSCSTADPHHPGKAVVQFDTAWSVPYPVISALNNHLQVPFEHRYYDEGSCFWGIETWGKPPHPFSGELVCRLTKRYKDGADKAALRTELTGYEPDADDDEEDE